MRGTDFGIHFPKQSAYEFRGGTGGMTNSFDVDWCVDRQEWLSRAQADSDCTVFQTPFWADVVSEAKDAEAVRVAAARFRNGSTVLLPLAQTWHSRKSGLASFVSMAASVYGGPIVDGPLSAAEISSALSTICRHHRLGAQSVTLIGSPRRKPSVASRRACAIARPMTAHSACWAR